MEKEKYFCDFLLELMTKENISQADLCRIGNLGRTTVSNLLSSKNSRPDPETCMKISAVFDVSLENVYRAAKLLPPAQDFPELDDLRLLLQPLTTGDRELVVDLVRTYTKHRKNQK